MRDSLVVKQILSREDLLSREDIKQILGENWMKREVEILSQAKGTASAKTPSYCNSSMFWEQKEDLWGGVQWKVE